MQEEVHGATNQEEAPPPAGDEAHDASEDLEQVNDFPSFYNWKSRCMLDACDLRIEPFPVRRFFPFLKCFTKLCHACFQPTDVSQNFCKKVMMMHDTSALSQEATFGKNHVQSSDLFSTGCKGSDGKQG